MRTLRLRLILTFVGVSLAGTLFSLVLVQFSTVRAFDDLRLEQARQQFSADALRYYQTRGTWDGAAQSLPAARPIGGDQRPVPLALADPSGRVVVPAGPWALGQRLTAEQLARGAPLLLDGQRIGTVLVDNQPLARSSAEQGFLTRTQQILFWSALGATAVALALGLVLARALTRPLRDLAAASRAMAAGDLRQQVAVRSQDELGDLAAAFNQMSADLSQAAELRQQMTADIAHDLRTPLAVLAGYLESMQDGTLTPTPARLALMDHEMQQLRRLVEDLRTLSLAEAGQLKLLREPLAPEELLTQVAQRYAHQAEQKEVRLHVAADPATPEINVDPERLVQVLANLMTNALRYTPAGGQITLACRPDAGQAALSVQDTGPGITPEHLPHIFDRFYRADKSRQQAEGDGASGLGLAIARSLVEAHGGRITAESQPGQGARFTITLPAAA